MVSNTVLDSKLFDTENYNQYKKQPWSRKYKQGLYFTALEEFGDELNIYIGYNKKSENNINWFHTPHALHDGYSAIKKLSKERNLGITFPSFSQRKAKKPFQAIKQALRSSPNESHDFINQSKEIKGTDFSYLYFSFDLIKSPYSKTAIVAKICCQVLMKKLTKNKTARWMVPVRLSESEGLQASYLGIVIDEKDSIKAIHKKLISKLLKEEHWGFHFLSKIGLFFGKKIMLYLTKLSILKDKTLWMGSVSNLGKLNASDDINELIALAPVRWHRPISIGMYQQNERQIVTISFHNSLKEVPFEEIEREIKTIYESYL